MYYFHTFILFFFYQFYRYYRIVLKHCVIDSNRTELAEKKDEIDNLALAIADLKSEFAKEHTNEALKAASDPPCEEESH